MVASTRLAERRSIRAGRRLVLVVGFLAVVALAGALLGESTAAAPTFTLGDQFGRSVVLADLRGRPVVLTFLYTHCPDVCPLTLTAIQAGLRGAATPATVVVVTVDPDRDTPERLREYAGAWPSEWRFLTGRFPEVAAVWRSYRVTVEKRPLAHSTEVHGAHAIVHSSRTVVIDGDGRLAAELSGQWTAADLAGALQARPSAGGNLWQRTAAIVEDAVRTCSDFAVAQPGLAIGVLALLLVPGLLLPGWLVRAVGRGARRSDEGG